MLIPPDFNKNPELWEQAEKIFPGCVNNIKAGRCPTCGDEIREADFRTEQDIKEYSLSGMCQKCLDEVFDNDDD